MAVEKRQIRLGLVGFGEVGSSIGGSIRAAGLESVVAFDIAAFDGGFSELIQRRAKEAKVTLVRTPAELAAQADTIIAVVPGTQSVKAAQNVAPHLDAHHLYIELASTTPKVKQDVGAALAASGAQVADGGIMRLPVKPPKHHLQIHASGPAVQRFADELGPWGMQINVVGPTLGAGTGIKIIRSVMMKGIEAIVVELGLGSARYGITEEINASLITWFKGRDYMDWMTELVTSDVIHAERRFHEAEMSAEALEEVGIDPIMTRATAARLQSVAQLGLKEYFEGNTPADAKTALDAIDAALKRRVPA